MCCIMLKHLSKSRNSVAILQSVESMWMLKSPRSRMEGEMELGEEFRERKAGFGLGGSR